MIGPMSARSGSCVSSHVGSRSLLLLACVAALIAWCGIATVGASIAFAVPPTCHVDCEPPPPAEPPIASMNVPQYADVGQSASLQSTSTAGAGGGVRKSEKWNFGDGSAEFSTTTGLPSTVHHTWNAPGDYTVTLTVTDSDLQSDTATATVRVGYRATLDGGDADMWFDSSISVFNNALTVTYARPNIVISDPHSNITANFDCESTGDAATCLRYYTEDCSYGFCGGVFNSSFLIVRAHFTTGSGNDTFNFSGYDGLNAAPYIDPGTGTNTVTGSHMSLDELDLSARTVPMTVTIGHGSGTATGSGETDTFTGIENVSTGSGADTISAQDGVVNIINCGDGIDHVTADANDVLSGDCEFLNGDRYPVDPPTNSVPPAITGTARSGNTLSCAPGTWSGAKHYDTVWNRDGASIAGAASATYTAIDADAGRAVTCSVTATNDSGGPYTPVASARVTIAPVAAQLPSSSGSTTVGGERTCVAAEFLGATSVEQHWLRDGVVISGANLATYTITLADAGAELRCAFVGTNSGGATEAASDAVRVRAADTSLPTISGPVAVGSTVTCEPGSWAGLDSATGTTFSWAHNGTAITATESSYVITTADAGTTLTCTMSVTNDGGTIAATSAGRSVPSSTASAGDQAQNGSAGTAPSTVVAPTSGVQPTSGVAPSTGGVSPTDGLRLKVTLPNVNLAFELRSGIRVQARCTAACSGVVRVTISGRLARSLHLTRRRAATFSLGTARISCGAHGCKKNLRIRPSRLARTQLGKLTRLVLTATVQGHGADHHAVRTARTRRTVTAPRRHAHHAHH